VTIGCASCGSSGGSASAGFLTVPIEDAAQWSPQLALARAWKVPWAPYLLSCRATFSDPSITTLPTVSLENGKTRLTQVSIVDRLVFQIDQPNAFDGNVFKPQSDFYFGLQSGIEATLNVDGAPRYAVAPFQTPIRTLAAMVAEAWPHGWVLGHTQTINMAFFATITLPSLPTTVIATYRMWQPVGTDEFVDMTAGQARAELRKIFNNNAAMMAVLDRADSAPVGR